MSGEGVGDLDEGGGGGGAERPPRLLARPVMVLMTREITINNPGP